MTSQVLSHTNDTRGPREIGPGYQTLMGCAIFINRVIDAVVCG